MALALYHASCCYQARNVSSGSLCAFWKGTLTSTSDLLDLGKADNTRQPTASRHLITTRTAEDTLRYLHHRRTTFTSNRFSLRYEGHGHYARNLTTILAALRSTRTKHLDEDR